jgi:flagellar hook assembly protein FlgD
MLEQGRPNPFVGETILSFFMPAAGCVEIGIYDIRGREVVRLLDDTVGPGWDYLTWKGEDRRGKPVSNGVYFCVLKTDAASRVRRLVRLR